MDGPIHKQGRRRRWRRGSAYMLVLGSTLIVTTMSVGSAMILTSEMASRKRREHAVKAEFAAQSVLELALMTFDNSAAARKEMSKGAYVLAAHIDGFKCAVSAEDENGDPLTDDVTSEIYLVARAEGAYASRAMKLKVIPAQLPVTAFDGSLHAAGNLTLSKTTLAGGPQVGATGNVVASGSSSISAPVYASGVVAGSTYTGGTSSGVAEKTMPSTGAMAYYASQGVTLSYASISGGKISNCVLGPGLNPYGSASPTGIYVINCGNKDLTIENCRISACLIIYNVKKLHMKESVHWTTPNASLPALVMWGDELNCDLKAERLSESGTNVNFNPPALPFQSLSDATKTSLLPNIIQGAMYVDGNLSIKKHFALEGSLVCTGTVAMDDVQATFTRPASFTVPAGFFDYELTTTGDYTRVTE